MKRITKVLVLLGITSTLTLTSALAQVGGAGISFDEWGNALGIGPGFIGADPSGGIPPAIGPVLMYPLPFGVLPGDVLLTEQPGGGTNTQFSDVVRFWNPAGNPNQSLIIFYSERPEDASEIPPPADIGLPGQLQSLVFGPISEIGTEAFNFALYTAFPGMPGSFLGGGPGIDYTIVSDGVVPEPSTYALAAFGGLLLFLKQRRQLQRK